MIGIEECGVSSAHGERHRENQKSDDSVSGQKLFGWFEWSNTTKFIESLKLEINLERLVFWCH